MSVSPAEGARVAWEDVPAPVRAAVEEACGAAVAEARTQPGGFSPGVAARVRCADGTRWFVKAATTAWSPGHARASGNWPRWRLPGRRTRRAIPCCTPTSGLPTIRQFQAAQGEVARRWLATLL